jgi:hypothetical protein
MADDRKAKLERLKKLLESGRDLDASEIEEAKRLEKELIEPQQETPSTTPADVSPPEWYESLGRSFAQGLSLGFEDELAGAANAWEAVLAGASSRLGEAVGLYTPEEAKQRVYEATGVPESKQRGFVEDVKEAYRRARDEWRAADDAAATAHPTLTTVGNITGGLLLPLPGPGKAKAGATVLQRMGQFAKAAAPVGAASAVGAYRTDEPGGVATPGEVVGEGLAGAGAGAAIGAALPPTLKLAAKLAGPIARAARRQAERWAVRSITPTAGLTNRLIKLGYKTEEQQREFGRKLLDAGIIPPGGTPESALQRAMDVLEAEGGNIGEWLEQADELVRKGIAQPASRSEAILAAKAGLERWAEQSDPATAVAKEQWPVILRKMYPGTWDNPLPGNTTYRNLWNTKSDLQGAFLRHDSTRLEQEARNTAINAYTRNVYEQLERAVGPDAKDEVAKAARTWGTAADARKLLEEAVSRGLQRSPVGLLDTQIGQVAASTEIPYAGPAVTAMSALVRSRIPSLAARGFDWASGATLRAGAFGPGADYTRPLRSVVDYYELSKEKRNNLSPRDEVATQAFLSNN